MTLLRLALSFIARRPGLWLLQVLMLAFGVGLVTSLLLLERGIGFTDIVKRPTRRAHELRTAEYAHGRGRLLEKLHRYRPELVIFSYKKTAEVLLGRFRGHGERPSPIEGMRMFVMPGPYEKADRVSAGLEQLRAFLAA